MFFCCCLNLPDNERETWSDSVTDGSSSSVLRVKACDGPDGGIAELLQHLVLVLTRVSSVMELLTQAAQKSLVEEERQVGQTDQTKAAFTFTAAVTAVTTAAAFTFTAAAAAPPPPDAAPDAAAAVPPGCVSLLPGCSFHQWAVGGTDEPSQGGSSQSRVAPPPAAHSPARRPVQFAHSTAAAAGGAGREAAAGSIQRTQWR